MRVCVEDYLFLPDASLRIKINENGDIFIARDAHSSPGPGPSMQPQHLVVHHGRLAWEDHEVGGRMRRLGVATPIAPVHTLDKDTT